LSRKTPKQSRVTAPLQEKGPWERGGGTRQNWESNRGKKREKGSVRLTSAFSCKGVPQALRGRGRELRKRLEKGKGRSGNRGGKKRILKKGEKTPLRDDKREGKGF